METPLQAVESIYAAFAAGDVPAILARLDPQVVWEGWEDNQSQQGGVPWMLERRGHAGVLEFFQLVGAWRIREFAVRSMMGGGNQVVVEVIMDADLPNGAHFRDEELHLWTFGPNGLVTRLRHYTDTAKHLRAAGLST